MAEISVVRHPNKQFSEQDLMIARNVIFGHVDGLGDKGKKQWRRLWNRLFKLEAGEVITFKTEQARLGWYHRKHMKLEQTLFESQERFEEFESFRTWLKVGAGFVEWFPGPKGAVIPVPKSISYSKLEQGEMEEVHAAMINFLRTEHAQKTLWKHLPPAQRSEMMEIILGGFNE